MEHKSGGMKMTKRMKQKPKPFIDALYEAEEGLEIRVSSKQSMFRQGEVIMLRTIFTAIGHGYKGDLIFNQPLVERQIQKPKIVKPK